MTERLVSDFLDWDEEELPPESEGEILQRLFRAIANNEGAGWFFVQCSPQKGTQVVKQLEERFGRVSVLTLDRESESFYPEAIALFEAEKFDVLVVRGVDDALLGYEDTKRALGWDSADLHNYDSRDVPPLLSHFNQVRECLRDTVPRPVVFAVSAFVVKYLLLRAPDFYDWRAGTFTLPLDEGDQLRTIEWVKEAKYSQYLNLSELERQQRIIDLYQSIETGNLSLDERADLLFEEGLLFDSGKLHEQSVSCYDKALKLSSDNSPIWNVRGLALQSLGRYEEALVSYDNSLRIEADYHGIWSWRGDTLTSLERYEEAITSYDKALEIKPDDAQVWYDRGIALGDLERYEEAITSYDKALEIEPDDDDVWNNRGVALYYAHRYGEAMQSFDRCLEIAPNNDYGLASKAELYALQGNTEMALSYIEKAIQINEQQRELIRKEPIFNSIRNDPRFQSLVEQSYYISKS